MCQQFSSKTTASHKCFILILFDHLKNTHQRCIRIQLLLTFPASGAVALDDPECLLQLVAVGEQVKETLSVVGTVAQVDGDFSGSNTLLAVRSGESKLIFHLYKIVHNYAVFSGTAFLI